MELKRDEIIKALECCGAYSHGHPCNKCPYKHIELADNEICSNRMSLDALALIKELTEENERLRAENDELCDNIACLEIDLENARTNTVRQMRERLTTFFAADDTLSHIEVDAEYINSQIDKIAKEMEEGL